MIGKYLEVQTLKKYKALNTFMFNNDMLIEQFGQTFKIISQKSSHVIPHSITDFLNCPSVNETI